MIPSEKELENALALRHGRALQKKLSAACAAVCGLGGLGSNIAISLARAGVGRLILIDFDKVDITNLNRQQYDIDQIGMYKTDALRANIERITPCIEIKTENVFLTDKNAGDILKNADIICEAFDKAENKAMLVNYVLENMPDKYLVAASGMAGIESGNTIKTRRVTDRFYLCGDGKSDVTDCGSLFAPRVMLCAAHQAQTVIRIIAGKEDKDIYSERK